MVTYTLMLWLVDAGVGFTFGGFTLEECVSAAMTAGRSFFEDTVLYCKPTWHF